MEDRERDIDDIELSLGGVGLEDGRGDDVGDGDECQGVKLGVEDGVGVGGEEEVEDEGGGEDVEEDDGDDEGSEAE